MPRPYDDIYDSICSIIRRSAVFCILIYIYLPFLSYRMKCETTPCCIAFCFLHSINTPCCQFQFIKETLLITWVSARVEFCLLDISCVFVIFKLLEAGRVFRFDFVQKKKHRTQSRHTAPGIREIRLPFHFGTIQRLKQRKIQKWISVSTFKSIADGQ